MTERHADAVDRRTDIRSLEDHGSWRQVYAALDVDPDAHSHDQRPGGGAK